MVIIYYSGFEESKMKHSHAAHFCDIAIGQRVRASLSSFPCSSFLDREVLQRVRDMFSNRSWPTWINVEPLSFAAVSLLVSKTLHRPKDDCDALSRFVYAASSGNAFSARSVLTTLQRQHHVWKLCCAYHLVC